MIRAVKAIVILGLILALLLPSIRAQSAECIDCDCTVCPSGCECLFIGGPVCYKTGTFEACSSSSTPTPPPTPGHCLNACTAQQTQQPYPNCTCMDIPVCPSRSLSSLSEPKTAAVIEDISGTAFVYTIDEQAWCSLPAGSANIVKTGESVRVIGGKARLRFYNGAIVDVAPGSEFTVNNIKIRPDGTLSGMYMEILKGVYHYIFPPDPYGKFELQVNSAFPGIKGTEFVIETNPDETLTLYLISGQIDAASISNPLAITPLSPGHKLSFAKDGTPGTPETYNSTQIQDWWNAGETPGPSAFCNTLATLATMGTVLLLFSPLFFIGCKKKE